MLAPVPPQGVLVAYGDHPSAFGRLQVPASGGDAPIVVLYHGGFWRRSGGDLNLMADMADALVADGYAVWNVEYGRSGERFGGWPYTFTHVSASLAALDALGATYAVDVSRPVLVGHSAGGHLALWAAAAPEATISGVVALAPIVDLELAANQRLGNGAVADLLGGEPDDVPSRYDDAVIGDLGALPVVVVTSAIDDSVPGAYSDGVSSSGLIERRVDSVDHLSMIRVDGEAWQVVTAAIDEFLNAGE